ncbi:MAG: sulfide/dihydroorotate dehydrogenase-like FAD/NAD-binding protein [Planctomycetes bacterium]|nr:sulfide/dihydroorotate dehydrogenase-like FAD/NAD-binding protein [Planctomycetota bacterium]
MFEIVESRPLGPDVKRIVVRAPRVARKQLPGQFVIVRVHDRGERIPLTICDSDGGAGTITLIVQGIGKTTRLINALEAGQGLLDVVGPLGNPSEIRVHGRVVVVAGGVGVAIALPTARALKDAGNHVDAILGARAKDLVILEAELRAASHTCIVTTDDGSHGRRGLVVDPLREFLRTGPPMDLVLAIGPIPMMRSVAEATREAAIPTVVSLNSIMVDGTGMCGGCRVVVGDQARFACVDGPEFDAHQVDFGVLAQRNAMYRDAERVALERFREHPERDLERVPRPLDSEPCRLAQRHPEWNLAAGDRTSAESSHPDAILRDPTT